MRPLLLLCVAVSLLASEPEKKVADFLAGRTQSYPTPQADELPLVAAALTSTEVSVRQLAWGLVFNLGPDALPIRDAVLSAYRAEKPERRRCWANNLSALGPLARDLVPEALAAVGRLDLSWPDLLQIVEDPATVLPALLADASSEDPHRAADAAEGLVRIAWCPAAQQAVPVLRRMLERWAPPPPVLPLKDPLIINWTSEEGDPDDGENFRRAYGGGPPDPWPSALAALLAFDPGSPEGIVQATSALTLETPSNRRLRALAALRYVLPERLPRKITLFLKPLLGPGPRGRLALRLYARLGAGTIPALEGLDEQARAAALKILVEKGDVFHDDLYVLPGSWAPFLPAQHRNKSEVLLNCGSAGIALYLATWNDDRCSYTTRIPPLDAPAGFLELLNGNGGSGQTPKVRRQTYEKTQWAGSEAEACWHTPWMRAWAVSARQTRGDDPLVLRLNALMAADGDVEAQTWLRADAGRLAAMAKVAPQLLCDRSDLLPDDLGKTVHAIADERQQRFAELQRQHAVTFQQWRQEEPILLLARLRRHGRVDVARCLLEQRRYVDEAVHVQLGMCLQGRCGPAEATTLIRQWGAERPRARLVLADLAQHPDPLIRRLAAEAVAPRPRQP